MSNNEPIGPVTAKIVQDLASAAAAVHSSDGVSFLVLPQGYTQVEVTKSFEKARDVPDRKRGTATLHSIDSFIEYAKDQGQSTPGYIYADVDKLEIVAVFNDFRAGIGGWRDHRASFKAELTPEAKKWLANSKTHMEQAAFAEFIEDNFADLAGDEAKKLLTVATTIAAATAISFSSARRLQDGQTQLTYNENISATAGADGTVAIPQKFDIGLRLFKGDATGYKISARLKYRLKGSNVMFWYELERPERALEDAFAGYIAKAKESGYAVLLGNPGPA